MVSTALSASDRAGGGGVAFGRRGSRSEGGFLRRQHDERYDPITRHDCDTV